jgi:hypothetical protein
MFGTLKKVVRATADLVFFFVKGGVYAARRKGVTVGNNPTAASISTRLAASLS